ncbi:PREDICTED: protein EURL homolog isoform X1 [Branchiostoma belcheri]|uniref:Protein EURL homolog isoform X1 n=1 Tax=Branchiostoma belcheri TaxID=7741 RepID=A0A6P4ZSG4_BRABE|nr:PREDICTED: protein EURL homolog isoform X1 [Branchiostoma belcheri]XP_019637050.1 PREDICTED: protein EURL homolog isoform X1 [Branchiostoma belcheri]
MRQLDLTRFDLIDLDTSECDICHQVTREELVHCQACLENSLSTMEKMPHTNSRGHKDCFDRWHDILRRSTPSPQRSPMPKAIAPCLEQHSTYSEVKDFVSTTLRWFRNDAQKPTDIMMQSQRNRVHQNITLPRYCNKRMDTRNKFYAQLQGVPVYKENTLLNLVKKKETPRPQFYIDSDSEEEERREIYEELRRSSCSSSEDEEDLCVYEKVMVPKRASRTESKSSGPLDFCIQLPITKEQLFNLNAEQLEACVAFLRMRIDDTSADLVSTLQERDWTVNQISVKHTVIYQLHKAQDRMPHLRPDSPNSRLIPAVNQSSQPTNHSVFRSERLMNTKA